MEKSNGRIEVCGGTKEYWKTVNEDKRNRKISLYKCSKCGLLYPPTQEI